MKPLLLLLIRLVATPLVVLGAPLFYVVARTGIGAGVCRKLGFQPILVHYYQPVPEYEALADGYFQTPQECPGYSIHSATVDAYLQQLSQFAEECNWPESPPENGGYHTDNAGFGFSSAAILHTMIRSQQSRRVVEIGGGYSSLVTLAALQRNAQSDYRFRCVEPYPSETLQRAIHAQAASAELIPKKAEEVDVDVYTDLEPNDILFIDSSHVSKLASDVNFLFLQVLPRLKAGVIVHVHDIYLPYDYPRMHFYGERKLFWNEQYLLQAFLTNNRDFEVIVPGYHVQVDHTEAFKSAFPSFDPVRHRPTTSFWMRKCG